MSFNKVIRFPEPPKAIAIGFLGDPPVPAATALANAQKEREEGQAEANSRFRTEVAKLRDDFGRRQGEMLSSVQEKVDAVLRELDGRLPDLVLGIAERVIGQVSLDRDAVEGIVRSLVSEFAGEDEKLEVYLCPDDLKLLKAFDREPEAPEEGEPEPGADFAGAIAGIFEGLDGEEALLEGYPNVTFHEDPMLVAGDCQIKSRFGLLDGRVATKLRKIEAELKGG